MCLRTNYSNPAPNSSPGTTKTFFGDELTNIRTDSNLKERED